MPYTLADLVNDRNRQLYEDLAARVAIELHPSQDSLWGEIMEDGVASISYVPSSYPVSCFTHELLHVHFDLLGMERPAVRIDGMSATQQREDDEFVRGVFPYFYNQLIHQKMYPLFITMGFPAEEFLGESDSENLRRVLANVSTLKKLRKQSGRDTPFRAFILPYLVAKSPHDKTAKTERMRKDLRNLSGGASYIVDDLIQKLVADRAPNMSWYLARLFYLCELPNVALGRDQLHLTWAKDTASGRPPSEIQTPASYDSPV